ncbi:MAG: CDP-glycerol glycerophosphotransferase family protein [Deltaproteobacteria bacterium]|nr:CDP-glycerol glycerophosphotransferase family protein [Deltaproteobacteria bacterium]
MQVPLLIIYYISGFFLRDPVLWLFGGWNGKHFRGNSKQLFLFVRNHCPDISAVWITKNRKLADQLIKGGFPAYYVYSLGGIWKTLRGKYFIVTHGIGDINEFVSRGGIMINLSHSIYPIKDMSFAGTVTFLRKIYFHMREPLRYFIKPDYAITASEFTAPATVHHYNISSNRVLPLGTPKTDFLLAPDSDPILFHAAEYAKFYGSRTKKILFLPTWRKDHGFSIFNFGFDPVGLDTLLKEIDAAIAFSFHPFTAMYQKIPDLSGFERLMCFHDSGDEMNYLLGKADMLITDYSALFADYLIYNKPIIFAKFDHDSYIRANPLYADYDHLPGPKAESWPELLDYIREIFVFGRDDYKSRREMMRDLIYPRTDGRACERIVQFIMSLCPQKNV